VVSGLRHSEPVATALGLPVGCAGNVALVYQVNGGKPAWAVKACAVARA
jgi:hypothetical protein